MTHAIFEQFSPATFELFLDGAKKRHHRFVDAVAWATMEIIASAGKVIKDGKLPSLRAYTERARRDLPLFEITEAAIPQHAVAINPNLSAYLERQAKKGFIRKRVIGDAPKLVTSDVPTTLGTPEELSGNDTVTHDRATPEATPHA